jgi:hypothetical protein
MNTLTNDIKRLVISKVDHDDDLIALTQAFPSYEPLVNETHVFPKKKVKRLKKLQAALPASKVVLRYNRRAQAALKDGTLFKKMRRWQEQGSVTFSDHVNATLRGIRHGCRSRRMPLLLKVCEVLEGNKKGTREERTYLFNLIMRYIDSIIETGEYRS